MHAIQLKGKFARGETALIVCERGLGRLFGHLGNCSHSCGACSDTFEKIAAIVRHKDLGDGFDELIQNLRKTVRKSQENWPALSVTGSDTSRPLKSSRILQPVGTDPSAYN
ncbi:MAG TPA: hypothetical protein VI282_09865, partial [Verrucomicrobiae bacterium]